MSFDFRRKYAVYIILGHQGRLPWRSNVWAEIATALEPLFSGPERATAVRTAQYAKRKKVSFGKLGWNDATKWTLGEADSRLFESLEAWSPSWTACEKRGAPPDVYLALLNEAMLGPGSVAETLAFGSRVLLAVALDSPVVRHLERSARDLKKVVGATTAATRERSWGRAAGSGFTNTIQDLNDGFLVNEPGVHSAGAKAPHFTSGWRTF